MNSRLFIFLFISLFAGVATFIATENIFISIAVLAVYLVVSFLLIIPKLKKYDILKTRFHECYHFINNLIVSLSIKKTIAGALETTVGSMPPEFIDMYNSVENISENEKLEYLNSYFNFHDYQLLLQIVLLWEDQGGDIIAMSKYLTNDIRVNEDYLNSVDSISKRKYFEIGVLWIITIAILVFLRFSLKDFYNKIKGQLIYVISIALVMLFALLTIFLLVSRGTNLNLKGNHKDEKVA